MKLLNMLLGLCLPVAVLAGCGRNVLPETSTDASHEAAKHKNPKGEAPAPKVATKGPVRDWQSGEQTFKAALVEVKDGKVFLWIERTGDTQGIPISRLSPADQKYVREQGGG